MNRNIRAGHQGPAEGGREGGAGGHHHGLPCCESTVHCVSLNDEESLKEILMIRGLNQCHPLKKESVKFFTQHFFSFLFCRLPL